MKNKFILFGLLCSSIITLTGCPKSSSFYKKDMDKITNGIEDAFGNRNFEISYVDSSGDKAKVYGNISNMFYDNENINKEGKASTYDKVAKERCYYEVINGNWRYIQRQGKVNAFLDNPVFGEFIINIPSNKKVSNLGSSTVAGRLCTRYRGAIGGYEGNEYYIDNELHIPLKAYVNGKTVLEVEYIDFNKENTLPLLPEIDDLLTRSGTSLDLYVDLIKNMHYSYIVDNLSLMATAKSSSKNGAKEWIERIFEYAQPNVPGFKVVQEAITIEGIENSSEAVFEANGYKFNISTSIIKQEQSYNYSLIVSQYAEASL